MRVPASYYEQALAIRKKTLGEEHLDTAASLNNLAFIMELTGDYAGARPYYEQSLAIRKKILGEEHLVTATSHEYLGGILQATGDREGAQLHYEQALAIRMNLLKKSQPTPKASLTQ